MFLSLFKKESIPQGWVKGRGGFLVWLLTDDIKIQELFPTFYDICMSCTLAFTQMTLCVFVFANVYIC